MDPTPAAADLTVKGDVAVAATSRVAGTLRASGRVSVGPQAEIAGGVEARSLALDEGAIVHGAVQCDDAEWHPTAASGPLACDGEFRVRGRVLAQRVIARRGISAEADA